MNEKSRRPGNRAAVFYVSVNRPTAGCIEPPSADIHAALVAFRPPEVQPSRMMHLDHTGRDDAHDLPDAEVAMRIGRNASLDVKVTNVGLLSVGILVSGILLSTAVLVHAAKRRVRA
ncbi:hypothetical protein H5J25_12735 [Sphingomonas aliaeris]|uniref:Uncharacterized protein n=1 Tax=Sphingomonas aliaeris TaxID=2759526 RepID=A0A974S3C1_9SPHN|nr:hypothetical protein [Sphingomonas aliaeris]QQV76348.1 hypothetical protein H5J25_12735 [Sphingomonas aliaeris]